MPDTVGSIRVLFEAQFGKYLSALSQMDRATGSFAGRANRQAATVAGAWRKAGSDMAGFTRQFTAALAAGLSVQAAKQLVDSAIRIRNVLKVAGLEGAELNKVYEKLFASAQKNGAPIESLATLYGRAAQQQKELGVTSEQLLIFTDNVALALRVAGTDATTASGALLQLGQALGSGTVHAEEFNSILEGAPTIAQAAAIGISEAGGSVAKLKQLVVDGAVSSKAFFDGFAAGAETLRDRVANSEMTVSGALVRMQNVLVDVAGRFDDSTHATRILANAINTTLIPAIQELGGIANWVVDGPIGKLYSAISATVDKIVQLSADYGAMTGLDKIGGNPYIGQQRIQDRITGAFAGTTYTTPKESRGGTEITVTKGTPVKPITLADYPITGGKGGGRHKGGGGGGRSADDRFTDNIQDVKDRTAALKEEQAALGMSFEAQQKRSVALQLEQEALRQVREEARRKGDADWQNAQLSPEQAKQIDEVSAAYARQADALRQATELQDLQRDVLKGIFSDVRNALSDGKITWQEWGDIALNALDKVIDKIEDQLVDAILSAGSAGGKSGGGGGIIGTLISGIGHLLGFAEGGDIRGPGGPTDDKVLIAASDGEHITRAKQANKYRGLLHAINGDTVADYLRTRAMDSGLAFAGGGAVITGDTSTPHVGPGGTRYLGGNVGRVATMFEPRLDSFSAPMDHISSGIQSMKTEDSGRTRVEVVLSPDLEARILDKSHSNAVAVTKAGIGNYDKNLPGRFADITERHG